MSRWLGYLFFAVWLVPILVLFFWDGYLSLQMWNYRIPKKDERIIGGGRKFAFQTNAADYTEVGQAYRRKSIRLEIALLIWVFGSVLVLIIISAILTQ
jgi:hypothetical protein